MVESERQTQESGRVGIRPSSCRLDRVTLVTSLHIAVICDVDPEVSGNATSRRLAVSSIVTEEAQELENDKWEALRVDQYLALLRRLLSQRADLVWLHYRGSCELVPKVTIGKMRSEEDLFLAPEAGQAIRLRTLLEFCMLSGAASLVVSLDLAPAHGRSSPASILRSVSRATEIFELPGKGIVAGIGGANVGEIDDLYAGLSTSNADSLYGKLVSLAGRNHLAFYFDPARS